MFTVIEYFTDKIMYSCKTEHAAIAYSKNSPDTVVINPEGIEIYWNVELPF